MYFCKKSLFICLFTILCLSYNYTAKGVILAKELETLTPPQFTETIANRIFWLEKVLRTKQEALENAPPGSVRIVRKKRTNQFYLRENKTDLQGKYIPRSQLKLASALCQKVYDQKIVLALQKEITYLKDFLENYQELNVTTACQKLPVIRYKAADPLTLTDAEYVEKWLAVQYRHKAFDPDTPPLFTENGKRVRSKSEVIIANALTNFNVPYRYEYPVVINRNINRSMKRDLVTFHPDFCCLNVKTRKEYIWEHFGKMDDPEYAKRAVEKIYLYNEHGYEIGKNLIVTMETSSCPMSGVLARDTVYTHFGCQNY